MAGTAVPVVGPGLLVMVVTAAMGTRSALMAVTVAPVGIPVPWVPGVSAGLPVPAVPVVVRAPTVLMVSRSVRAATVGPVGPGLMASRGPGRSTR